MVVWERVATCPIVKNSLTSGFFLYIEALNRSPTYSKFQPKVLPHRAGRVFVCEPNDSRYG